MSEISSLLDATLDDLADLPEFFIFPDGEHKCTINWEEKMLGKHPALCIKLKAIETTELADSDDTPLKEGDTSEVPFMLDNEYGQGALKKVSKPIMENLGCNTLREMVEQCKDLEVFVVTKKRADKNDKSKIYLGIQSLTVA